MPKLIELFLDQKSKVVDKWEQYFGVYEAEFCYILAKGAPIRLLEVGVQNGGSLELWAKYLPEGSTIVGVDIDPKCGDLRFDSPDISVHVLDASDPYAIPNAFAGQEFDVIIDDGSHISSDIISTFRLLYPLLVLGGKYIIEDLECSYYETHEGGLQYPRSSIEWLKNLIDAVNADHIRKSDQATNYVQDVISQFRMSIGRVTFYDSVAVVEKLEALKDKPFRRMLSGQDRSVVPAFELLALQPQSVYRPMFFGSAAAKQVDESIAAAYEAARAELDELKLGPHDVRKQWESKLAETQKTTAALYDLLAIKDAHIATINADNAILRQGRELAALRSLEIEKLKFQLAALLGRSKIVEKQGTPAIAAWESTFPEVPGLSVRDKKDDYRLRAASFNERLLKRRADHYAHLADHLRNLLTSALNPGFFGSVRYIIRRILKRQIRGSAQLEALSHDFRPFDSRGVAQLAESGLFDRDFYVDTNKDLDAQAIDPAEHFLSFGMNEGRDPHIVFSSKEYWADHPDVAAQGLSPFWHFVQSGALEGRAFRSAGNAEPSVDRSSNLNDSDTATSLICDSGLFDLEYYQLRYADAPSTHESAVRHYVVHGADEGRDPCEAFSTSGYRSMYPEVDQEGVNPFVHYIVHGAIEGREPRPYSPPKNRSSRGKSSFSSAEAEVVRLSGLFHDDWYRDNNEDVKALGIEPFDHFMECGLVEDRKPNHMFEPEWYRTFYQDVETAGANPFLHYIQWGAKEGRSPCPGFDGQWYLESNPDVLASGENPLKHYMRIGKQEGRLPTDPNAAYRQYVLRDRQLLVVEAAEIQRHIDMMQLAPRFLIFIQGSDAALRERTRASLTRQCYSRYEVLAAERISQLAERGQDDEEAYLVWLSEGDMLHERALYEFASAINADGTVRLVYADEDVMCDGKRLQPFFKPDWSPDYLESLNYVGAAACFSMRGAWQDLAGASSHYDFVLRVTERFPAAAHIRKVLCHLHRGALHGVETPALVSGEDALKGRLLRTGRRASVKPVAPDQACFHITSDSVDRPLVSIIIPTAGQIAVMRGAPVDLLVNCIDKILSVSTYKNLEFVIVDNGDLGAERASMMDNRGYKRLSYTDPEFNIAKKLNLGAEAATGELLLLLNDDIEPLVPDWIERMVDHFEKDHVGVVGSKLLYPDLTTQHVGVVLNAGVPDHVRRFKPRDDDGYFFSTAAVRNFIAVTGACMMTRASTFEQVGGYTVALGINYNDTDYCLKVIEAGKTIVYAPRSELIHFESQSREARLHEGETEYFTTRWGAYAASDPYYNERYLTVASPTFEVANNPRLI